MKSLLQPSCSRSAACNEWTISRMPCIVVLVYCLLLPVLLTSSQQQQPFSSSSAAAGSGEIIEYSVYEELPPNTYVGNIKTNSNLLERYGAGVLDQLELDFHHSASSGAGIYSYFKLDKKEGTLRTARPLDREQLWPYTDLELSIRVTPFQYFQILKVLVHVIDKNDNVPVFPDSSLTLSLPETTRPGSLFAVPNADDADSGKFGVQIYELVQSPGFERFDISMTNHSDGTVDVKLVLTRELDRELRSRYEMTLIAWDGGQPPQSGSLQITVNVVDANDNSPTFARTDYVVQLRENVPRGASVIRVSATDMDYGLNGQVVYSLATHNDEATKRLFSVNATTGEMVLQGTLDYETTRAHTVSITAHDLGPNPFSAFARVVVHVEDVNDNVPQIVVHTLTGHNEAAIWENCSPGTFVTHLAVTDADDGDNGKVDCIIDGRMFELLRLSESEYKIVTRGQFDSEEREQYHVRVSCSDNGQPSQMTTKTVIVNVQDENDNSPFFLRDVYYVNVREGNAPKSVVIKMNATDRDSGMNGALTYSMVPLGDTPKETFVIEQMTGVVRAPAPLDYEKRSRYSYMVVATDAGVMPRSVSTTLNITVLDVNDEIPLFSNATYVFYVVENRPPPMNVGIVLATDDDEPPFDRVVYSLSAVHQYSADLFAIDKDSGLIITLKPLDRELASEHQLTVSAANDGYPEVFNKVNVTVRVSDVNDNVPYFVFPSGLNNTVILPSDTPVDVVFARLRAADADSNAVVSFFLSSGQENGIFIVDAVTGDLRLVQPVQMFNNNLFKLKVSVSDGGGPSHVASSDLNVHILKRPESNALSNSEEGSLVFLRDNYFIIIIGILSGTILVVIIIVLSVIALHFKKRRSSKPSDRYVARSRNSRQPSSPNTKPDELHSMVGVTNGNSGVVDGGICKPTVIPSEKYATLLSNGHVHKGNTVRWLDLPAEITEIHPLTETDSNNGSATLVCNRLSSQIPNTSRSSERMSPQSVIDWNHIPELPENNESADGEVSSWNTGVMSNETGDGLCQRPSLIPSPCSAPCPQSSCCPSRLPRTDRWIRSTRLSAQPSAIVGLRPGDHQSHYRGGHSPMTSSADVDSDGTESITDSGRGGSEEGEHFVPRLLTSHHQQLRSPASATSETISLRQLPCPSPSSRSLQSNRSASPRVVVPVPYNYYACQHHGYPGNGYPASGAIPACALCAHSLVHYNPTIGMQHVSTGNHGGCAYCTMVVSKPGVQGGSTTCCVIDGSETLSHRDTTVV